MARNFGSIVRLLVLALIVGVIPSYRAEGEEEPPQQQSENTEQPSETPPLQERLKSVVESIQVLESRIKEKTKELRAGQALGKEDEARAELKGLREQRDALRSNFSELISQTDLSGLDESTDQQELDLEKEVRSLLGPLIKELKELTRRPREIERIRSEIIKSELRLSRIEKAIENIQTSKTQLSDKAVLAELDEAAGTWEAQRKSTTTEIEIGRQRLQQKEAEKVSLSAALGEIFGLFFRSRGRNLIVAFIIAGLFWFCSLQAWKRIMNMPAVACRRSLMPLRFLNLLAIGGSCGGALIAFALVLYFFGDWVLLVLTLALIFGIVWTSKQAFARFWAQLTMLMNVGSVREGEVVILDQLPWIVQRLNLHSQLVNPRLSGGVIRVPLNQLLGLRSRPLSTKERLFPTREGDWVVLSDDNFGQIILQTPEVVRVELPGGAQKMYPTNSFLGLYPRVLSKGFRLNETFGVDYRHQRQLVTEIVPSLRQFIDEGLAELGLEAGVVSVAVEVEAAGASSLDLAVICDCAGDAAPLYDRLRRLIRRLCIEACNAFNWTIPFNQMVVHVADSSGRLESRGGATGDSHASS